MLGFERFLGVIGQRPFNVQLRCYSIVFFPRADKSKINTMDYGGNILLPNSALDVLTRLNVEYPLLFKISGLNPDHQRVTHAGVLEFLAEEGKCYLPSWMMRQLMFIEGELASIEYKSLPMATYAKLKPMSLDFLNISNPRAILEVELRKFRCLTKNDVICMAYNEQILEFKIMDLKPENAVSITECDVNLEFDAPEGYVESNNKQTKLINEMPEAPIPIVKQTGWVAFSGKGMRLDGKIVKSRTISNSSMNEQNFTNQLYNNDEKSSNLTNSKNEIKKNDEFGIIGDIIVDENYSPGHLKFIRFKYTNRCTLLKQIKEKKLEKKDASKKVFPFDGSSFTIRSQKF